MLIPVEKGTKTNFVKDRGLFFLYPEKKGWTMYQGFYDLTSGMITQRRNLKFYKIQWNQHTEDEATWETQDFLEKNFPGFLASCKL